MIPPHEDEPLSLLEAARREGLRRRRPRRGGEDQSARCPLCNRLLVIYLSVRGPAWRCGCQKPPGQRNELG